jgi:hypothetical protein
MSISNVANVSDSGSGFKAEGVLTEEALAPWALQEIKPAIITAKGFDWNDKGL